MIQFSNKIRIKHYIYLVQLMGSSVIKYYPTKVITLINRIFYNKIFIFNNTRDVDD